MIASTAAAIPTRAKQATLVSVANRERREKMEQAAEWKAAEMAAAKFNAEIAQHVSAQEMMEEMARPVMTESGVRVVIPAWMGRMQPASPLSRPVPNPLDLSLTQSDSSDSTTAHLWLFTPTLIIACSVWLLSLLVLLM